MKKFRLAIVAILAAFSGLCAFSLVSGWESGSNSPILAVLTGVSGLAAFVLGRKWDREGKLPEEVSNRNNDMA